MSIDVIPPSVRDLAARDDSVRLLLLQRAAPLGFDSEAAADFALAKNLLRLGVQPADVAAVVNQRALAVTGAQPGDDYAAAMLRRAWDSLHSRKGAAASALAMAARSEARR